jgi:hypothetical protein
MTYEIDAKRGVANHYGPRSTDAAKGGQTQSVGQVKQAAWTFTWDNLPAAGASNLEFVLPAGASIVSAKLAVDEAWNAVVDVGTGASAVGFWDDADLSTDGDVLTSAGALVGAKLGADAEVVVTSAATAGKATLIVEYYYGK